VGLKHLGRLAFLDFPHGLERGLHLRQKRLVAFAAAGHHHEQEDRQRHHEQNAAEE
jgi:hypothetical protein